MLSANAAITARRCSLAITPVLRRPNTHKLPDDYFSLGQDRSYYEDLLEKLGKERSKKYLQAIRDVAYDQDLFSRVKNENVTRTSLLRGVPLPTVRGQFARLARGQNALTSYHLKASLRFEESEAQTIDFQVVPNSTPPTNIHVLVGRNGVGKSTFLANFANEISQQPAESTRNDADDADIANVVSVSFSAFDSFRPVATPEAQGDEITTHYVGLRDPEHPETIRDSEELQKELARSALVCLQGARRDRWVRGLELLEADPLFEATGLSKIARTDELNLEQKQKYFANRFTRLSSGHAIVFLTLTKLVETVEEKSLVLIDEPEGHLHPPLLSAFIRALSDLLIRQNGLAIVATHSPVVLQEVPRSCVWKFYRSGTEIEAERPQIETFGENVGTLTYEVFGLEVNSTGFHRMLSEAIRESGSYEEVLSEFESQLGFEGRAILRAMENSFGGAFHVEG